MAFEITDLMIQVVTGSPHADKEPKSHCPATVTCKATEGPTRCQVQVTCVREEPSHCKGDHSCQVPSRCLQVTCEPAKKSLAETELDALLDQLRATLAETAAV